jgi:hypothetical protein
MRSGVVTVRDAIASAPDVGVAPVEAPPPPVDAPQQDPLPGSEAFQALSIAVRARIVNARCEARQAARRAANLARLRAMPDVYG